MKLNAILIVILGAIVAFNVYMFTSNKGTVAINFNATTTTTTTSYLPTQLAYNCTVDSDCEWKSTNCCTENAGAHWECIGKGSYIDCQSTQTLCPQFVSNKPSLPCACIGGRCG